MSHAESSPSAAGAQRRKILLISALVGGAAIYFALPWTVGQPWVAYPLQTLLMVAVMYLIAVGADGLVDAASLIAKSFGVSDLIIGLTVVAFGTSAPEIAASLVAGFQGKGDITIANIVGSNVFNICFILGGVALLVRGGLHIERELLLRDGPVLLTGTVLLFLFVGAWPGATQLPHTDLSKFELFGLFDLRLQWLEGLLLFLALVVYLYFLFRIMRTSRRAQKEQRQAALAAKGDDASGGDDKIEEEGEQAGWRDYVLLLVGLVLVVGGSHFLVGHVDADPSSLQGFGALWFARMWDIPDYVVGVTIVAAGTSAPEFVVSLVAASRGNFGMSAGNLLGSDIFNMFGVVGLAGLVLQPPLAPPVSVSVAVVPSLLALSAVILLTIFFMWTGRRISRFEGAILVLIGVGRWVMDFMSRA